jgi:hypothetical protein
MVNPYPKADLRHLAVMRIRDILVRIRIRGSMPLTKAVSAVYVIVLLNANKITIFFRVATSMKDFKARGEALGRHSDVKPFFSKKIAQVCFIACLIR